jgi:hypothetical protein
LFILILFFSLPAFGGPFSKQKSYEVYEFLSLLPSSFLVLFTHSFCLFFDHLYFSFSFLSFKAQWEVFFFAISSHIVLGRHRLYRVFRWGSCLFGVFMFAWGWVRVGWAGAGLGRGLQMVGRILAKKREISLSQ